MKISPRNIAFRDDQKFPKAFPDHLKVFDGKFGFFSSLGRQVKSNYSQHTLSKHTRHERIEPSEVGSAVLTCLIARHS